MGEAAASDGADDGDAVAVGAGVLTGGATAPGSNVPVSLDVAAALISAGSPAALDGQPLLATLNQPVASGGLREPNGAFHNTDPTTPATPTGPPDGESALA